MSDCTEKQGGFIKSDIYNGRLRNDILSDINYWLKFNRYENEI